MATPLVFQKNKNNCKKAKFMKMSGWTFFIVIIIKLIFLPRLWKEDIPMIFFFIIQQTKRKTKKGCLYEITDGIARSGGF